MNKQNLSGIASIRLVALLLFSLSLAVACAPCFAADSADAAKSAGAAGVTNAASAADAGKSYEARLAGARALADEKSWALARDAYAAAAKLAPDADAKRWCELWLAQAEWRAAGKSWAACDEIAEKIKGLLSPYQATPKQPARERDHFWAEATALLASAKSGYYPSADSWALWREVLAYWLEQPPSAEAGEHLMQFLRGLNPYLQNAARNGAPNRFAETLAAASKSATLPADDRAWCALAAAWLWTRESSITRKARALELWQEAAIACRGTPCEAVAEACLLSAQAFASDAGAAARGMTVNRELWRGGFGALLARARELEARVRDAPQSVPMITDSVAKGLAELIKQWSGASVRLDVSSVMRPGETVEFAVSATHCGELVAELYEFGEAGYMKWREFQNSQPAGGGGGGGSADGVREFLRLSEAKLAQSMTLFEGMRAEDYVFRSGVFRFPPLKKGFYYLVVRARADSENESVGPGDKLIVVSEVKAFALAPSRGDMQLYVLRRADESPVANAPVNFAWLARKDTGVGARKNTSAPNTPAAPAAPQPPENWSGASDANGRLLAPMPAAGEIIGYADGQPLLVSVSRPYGWDAETKKFMADIFFDRPLYRPGETVHWKLVARERREGRFAAYAGAGALSVEIGDGKKLADEAPLKFNSFGTAHGEFVIPAGTRPGAAACEVSLGDSKETMRGAFRVDNFQPAPVRASVTLADGTESARPGGEVAVRAKVEYFSGGAAAGVPVSCKLTVIPEWENEGADEDADGRNIASMEKCIEWARELAKREPQRAVTDANGEAVFTLKLREDLPNGSSLYVSCLARPDGMPGVSDTAFYGISKAGYFINNPLARYPRLVDPGTENTFALDIVDAAGEACTFEGEASFYERRWVEVWLDEQGRRVSGAGLANVAQPKFAIPQGWTKLFAGYVKTQAGQSVPVSCGADGRLVVRFTPPREGIYEMRLEKDGRELNESSSLNRMLWNWGKGGEDSSYASYNQWPDYGWQKERRMILVAANESTTSLAFERGDAYVLGLERYRAGKPLRCVVVMPEDYRDMVLSLTGEQRTVSQRVSLKNRVGVVTVADVPATGGALEGKLLGVNWGGTYATAKIPAPDERSRIALEITPAHDAARPGDTNTLTLNARDFEGKPLRAEVAVAVTDNSVNELAEAAGLGAGMIGTEPEFFGFTRVGNAQWSMDGTTRGFAEDYDSRTGAALVALCGGDSGGGNMMPALVVEEQSDVGYAAASTTAGSRVSADSQDTRFSEAGEQNDAVDAADTTDAVTGIRLRRYFSWTAFWEPELKTGADGRAQVSFTYPDNLTQWRVAAYAVGADGNTFGVAQALTRTSLPLQARVLAPRFLIEGDEAALPGLFVDRAGADLSVTANMTGGGALDLVVEPVASLESGAQKILTPKQGEARASWQAKAREPGEAVVTLVAKGGTEGSTGIPARDNPHTLQSGTDTLVCANPQQDSAMRDSAQTGMSVLPSSATADAMRVSLPVLEDGIRQDTAACARLASGAGGAGGGGAGEKENSASMTLPLPDPLNRERLRAEVVITQGRAGVMLDALPYLIDYPYGCVEQTMSRFLPAVVVKKTLADFGFDAAAVERRIMAKAGGEPDAAQARRERSAGLQKLDDVVAQSLGRLREAYQYGEGYGWWPDSRGADLWMTAYVAWGLQLAKEAGVTVSDDWLESVRDDVRRELREGKTTDDRAAWALFVVSEIPLPDFGKDSVAVSAEMQKVYARIYAEREKLSASGRACLLAASARWGTDAERAVLLRNLENGAQRAAQGAGAGVHWGATSGYWRATEGAVETTSLTVLALLKVAPDNALVEPALDWLAQNRRGAGWQNTRASAFAVLALARSVADGSGSARVSRAAPGVPPGAWERGQPACEGLGGTPKPAREMRALPGQVLGMEKMTGAAEGVASDAPTESAAGADVMGGESVVGIFLNGKKLRDVSLSRETLLAGAVRVALPAELLRGGDNRIELRRGATGGNESANENIYATALASAWARGDDVKQAGNQVWVARDFSGRRVEQTLGGDGKWRATAMAATGAARAGDEVTARVRLSAPGELEYVMVAVPRPAGCEPLNPLSGWDAELVRVSAPASAASADAGAAVDASASAGANVSATPDAGAAVVERRTIYREEHDDHSAFFLDHIDAGEWEIRFTMRAVTPGNFRALPVKVEAMYAPEIRANSDARRVRVEKFQGIFKKPRPCQNGCAYN